jgi:predicted enzyme related to lactoylglutathione lyase
VSERGRYPAGVLCWVDTAQPDPKAALDFYGSILGWEFAGPGPMPGGIPGQYFVAQVNGRDVAGIGSLPDPGAAASWNTYVRVDSADEIVERARQAGGNLLIGPLDAAPAGRLAVLTDPAGAAICVWEASVREGAQLVNEPRTWAMSSLHVNDSQAAAAFYGSAFGWQAESVGSTQAPLTLFRLPGYVGGEARQRSNVGSAQWRVAVGRGDRRGPTGTRSEHGGDRRLGVLAGEPQAAGRPPSHAPAAAGRARGVVVRTESPATACARHRDSRARCAALNLPRAAGGPPGTDGAGWRNAVCDGS